MCGAIAKCTCSVIKKVMEMDERNKLMEFLMELNEDYEAVRNQILNMDPMPVINKAFYMVEQVAKQKHISGSLNIGSSSTSAEGNNNTLNAGN